MKKFLLLVVFIIFFAFDTNASQFSNKKDDEWFKAKVTDHPSWFMCSIVKYLHNIGGPIITLVIIGASLLAIFGRMPWPALFALGAFTAVFFGAQAILVYVAPSDTHNCYGKTYQPSPIPLAPRVMFEWDDSWWWPF